MTLCFLHQISFHKNNKFLSIIFPRKSIKNIINGVSPKLSDYVNFIDVNLVDYFIVDSQNNILGLAKKQNCSEIPLRLYKVFASAS